MRFILKALRVIYGLEQMPKYRHTIVLVVNVAFTLDGCEKSALLSSPCGKSRVHQSSLHIMYYGVLLCTI
jgi:hypothetical protein